MIWADRVAVAIWLIVAVPVVGYGYLADAPADTLWTLAYYIGLFVGAPVLLILRLVDWVLTGRVRFGDWDT